MPWPTEEQNRAEVGRISAALPRFTRRVVPARTKATADPRAIYISTRQNSRLPVDGRLEKFPVTVWISLARHFLREAFRRDYLFRLLRLRRSLRDFPSVQLVPCPRDTMATWVSLSCAPPFPSHPLKATRH